MEDLLIMPTYYYYSHSSKRLKDRLISRTHKADLTNQQADLTHTHTQR
jgi:hypothetical protein